MNSFSHTSVPFGRRITRLLPAFVFGLALLPFGAMAAPSEDAIEIVATKGEVMVSTAGAGRAARAGSTLRLPVSLRTGHDSSADLRQGPTTIGIGPDTQLDFPAPADRSAAIERVIQPLGNAFYNVGARDKKRLRVETPYLVAVIKGTQFNVVVDAESSTISLFEGSLEVLATDGDDIVQLNAGEIAIRRRGDDSIRVLRMKDRATAQTGAKGGGKGDGEEPTKATPGTNADGPVTGTPLAPVPQGEVTGTVDVDLPDLPLDPVDGNVKIALGGNGESLEVGVETTIEAGPVGVDAGVDAGVDLGAGTVDLGVDAGVDLGGLEADLGLDAGVDAAAGTVDLDLDADVLGVDAGVDAGVDLTGDDAGVDLGIDLLGLEIDVDLGLDLGLDLGGEPDAPAAGTQEEDSGGLLSDLLKRLGR